MPWANIAGIDLYYGMRGEGSPLFLIQGYTGGHRVWFGQKKSFSKYFQVVIPDTRGVSSSNDYTVRRLADDIVQLMDHLGIEKAHLLGLSMGGLIVQEVAINYPERVMKIILASTMAKTNDEVERKSVIESYSEGDLQIHTKLGKVLGLDQDEYDIDIYNIDVVRYMVMANKLGFNTWKYRALMIPFAKKYANMIGVETLRSQLQALWNCYTFGRLHLINAQTLIICGANDRLIPPVNSDIIASRIPNAKLVKIERGSHSIHIENRKRFNEEVLNFLKGSSDL